MLAKKTKQFPRQEFSYISFSSILNFLSHCLFFSIANPGIKKRKVSNLILSSFWNSILAVFAYFIIVAAIQALKSSQSFRPAAGLVYIMCPPSYM